MLTQLHIKNFALIEDLKLEFSGQLNVLTGETGAGKSILIDAIRFVLGERMEGLRVESNDKPCQVEAAFELCEDLLKKQSVFEPYLAEEGLLVLRREFSNGKTRAWINHRLAPLSVLKEVGAYLVDIHGQYDHQRLLDSASHLDLLDRLAKIDPLREGYRVLYEQYSRLTKEQEDLTALEEHKEREMDVLKYQVDEIEHAEIQDLDEEALELERMRLANAEKLAEIVSHALAVLDENDTTADSFLSEAVRDLKGLVKFDSSVEKVKTDCENVQYSLQEAVRALRDYRDKLTFDPDRLRELEKKADLLAHLKRKYGGTHAKVLEFYQSAKAKYDKLIDVDMAKSDLQKDIRDLEPKLREAALKFSEKRKKAGAFLKRTIESELKDLQIAHAEFEVRIEETDFSAEGMDRVEFLARMNPGQPMLAIAKIISGGEASRVMLAMKKALMQVDSVPVLIFDEIDTNIGGRLGHVTGQKLKSISGERQVLLVTHLPQIASFADRHIKVTKSVQKGRTLVQYQLLEGEDKVRELAQMMSGQKESEISRRHAEE
ncbi:MAG: DNA repair protein RecN, partial [Candidatus Omnitrophota bacterium]